jgi:hypothetical protein
MATTNNQPSRPASRSVSSNSPPSRRPSHPVELSPAEKEKEGLIAAACRDRDLAALVHLATSTSGLVSDSLRRTACTFPRIYSDMLANRDRASAAGMHRACLDDAVGEATAAQGRASGWPGRQPRLRLLPKEWYASLHTAYVWLTKAVQSQTSSSTAGRKSSRT